ncbi:unnamed protein product [Staurois parvus]|uniref:Uncharacterized protein n=1 Tax=Staurois parvus TaxID=386267 RepID=A0ABN9ABJ1_9NEOB|nr:unnamed protein product [Staurois parvus]
MCGRSASRPRRREATHLCTAGVKSFLVPADVCAVSLQGARSQHRVVYIGPHICSLSAVKLTCREATYMHHVYGKRVSAC